MKSMIRELRQFNSKRGQAWGKNQKDVSPVLKYYATLRLESSNTIPDRNPDLSPFKLKIGTPVTPARQNVVADFGYSFLPLHALAM